MSPTVIDLRRRALLKSSLLLYLAGLSPGWAATGFDQTVRRLLLVELSGGNDGLNTVVPYATPLYRTFRPTLAIPREQIMALDDQVGLHPSLSPLWSCWKADELAVVMGLGFEPVNRSHFRSIEIWDTGTAPEAYASRGWLADALRQPLADAASGLVIGRNPRPLSGGAYAPMVINDRRAFRAGVLGEVGPPPVLTTPALRHVLAVQQQLLTGHEALRRARPEPIGRFPSTTFGRDLRDAARFLMSPVAAPVVKVTLGGFDTHVRQLPLHARRLSELAEGLAALRTSLMEDGSWDHTVVATYSEFGRRVRENGSQGTDHGTAAPHFVLGGAVRGGLYGAAPSLGDLRDGDLKVAIDYRIYLQSLAALWLQSEQQMLLPAGGLLSLFKH